MKVHHVTGRFVALQQSYLEAFAFVLTDIEKKPWRSKEKETMLNASMNVSTYCSYFKTSNYLHKDIVLYLK